MSVFLGDAARASKDGSLKKHKHTTNLTRLPTVMTRKEPKVKPPSSPPGPQVSAGGKGGMENQHKKPDGQEGPAGNDAESSGGQYEGMDRDQLLEEFRQKQAEREAARRKMMDEEVRHGRR